MSRATNVTQLPARKEDEPWVCAFSSRYMNEMFDGTGWIRAAEVLERHSHSLSAGMQSFVAQMKAKKKRPTTSQLALLVSLIVNVQAQGVFARWTNDEKEGKRTKKSASVISLRG